MGLDVPNFLTFRNIINYQKIDFFLGGVSFTVILGDLKSTGTMCPPQATFRSPVLLGLICEYLCVWQGYLPVCILFYSTIQFVVFVTDRVKLDRNLNILSCDDTILICSDKELCLIPSPSNYSNIKRTI